MGASEAEDLAGTDGLDDADEWSEGDLSEEDDDESEWTVWERACREGEQYLPPLVLRGLMPECLVEQWRFYQANAWPNRTIRGYPLTPEGDEEPGQPTRFLDVQLVKCGSVPSTQVRGWSALIAQHQAHQRPLFLLNLLYAAEGTPLHSLSRLLTRLDDLSHVLAWTRADPRKAEPGTQPSIDLVELPRLGVSFRCEQVGGVMRLCCLDYGGLFVPNGPPTSLRSEAWKLLVQMPHAILLQNENSEFSVLTPNVKPVRPIVQEDPFSTELVLARSDKPWQTAARNKTFLYAVHPTLRFLQPATQTGALYLLLMEWLHRRHGSAAALVSSISTDDKLDSSANQIYEHFGHIAEPHPDTHALRLQVSLALRNVPGLEKQWDIASEMVGYLNKLSQVSARCRLGESEEAWALKLCRSERDRRELIRAEVKALTSKSYSALTMTTVKIWHKILTDAEYALEAPAGEVRELEDWIKHLRRKLRAAQLPGTNEEIRAVLADVLEPMYTRWTFGEEDPSQVLSLENREAYLEALHDPSQRPLYLAAPKRPEETKWQTHLDENALVCSLYDILFEVLGAEHLHRPEGDEEADNAQGPDIPLMRRLSLPLAMEEGFKLLMGGESIRDAPTWALLYSIFTRSLSVRLSRSKEVNPQHQHTFGLMLLHLTRGSRFPGYLVSILHIMAQNPEICAQLPQLTKPKKVRLVKQWKAKLAQLQKSLHDAAYGNQLSWPPQPKDFFELPSPILCEVGPQLFAQPPKDLGALNPVLVFGLKDCNAMMARRPVISGLSCPERILRPSKACSVGEDLEALASQPLRNICKRHLLYEGSQDKVGDSLPFDLDDHPAMKHAVAQGMIVRLVKEMKQYASMRNTERYPLLLELDVEGVVADAPGKQQAAAQQLTAVKQALEARKTEDERLLAQLIDKLFISVDTLPSLGEDTGDPDQLRFWLLRTSEHETRMWFELLCRSLLSPDIVGDFRRFNPFLTEDEVEELMRIVMHMMLITSRRNQTGRALDNCRDLARMLEEGAGDRTAAARRAGLLEKASLLCSSLAAVRTYVRDGAAFDPRFMVFEFVTGFLLRPRQVEMVQEFLNTIRGNSSAVKQMIMGQGKTTVVTPLLALVLADTTQLVCVIVPQALLEFSRSVLRSVFSSVLQKQVSTFRCDRAVDLDVNLSAHVGLVKEKGDLIVTTPGDIKSLVLRFLEQLEVVSDRRAKRNTPQLRRETLEMGKVLELLRRESVCMIDEVDMVLHPLKSELNFPTGPKSLIHHAPERWRLPLHILEGFFAAENSSAIPPQLKESHAAMVILGELSQIIRHGSEQRLLQKNPHLILLNDDFYHDRMKGILCQWLGIWLTSEHVARVFEVGYTPEDRGLSEDEITAYLIFRTNPLKAVVTGTLEQWRAWTPEASWLWDLVRSQAVNSKASGDFDPEWIPKDHKGYTTRTSYAAAIKASSGDSVSVELIETPQGLQQRLERVDRLPAKDVQTLNLGAEWLSTFLPHCLQKIDRVTFGIMTDDQVKAALDEQPLMPLTRAKLAIPFIGKDVPSPCSEFAHPDIVLGLTSFAYRYEGLRHSDFDEVMAVLAERLDNEGGSSPLDRPTAMRWKAWVEEAGAVFCVKQREMDDMTADEQLKEDPRADTRARVLPLHLLEKTNKPQMERLFQLFRKLPSAVHFHLEVNIFPNFMRFQEQKFSASGQELGGSILFKQRLGFSGTPSELLPLELGKCEYEPGSEGEVVHTLTSTSFVSFQHMNSDWTVEALLDAVVAAAQRGECQALIDTGALITGLTNKEVAEHLLGFRKRVDGSTPLTLPETVDGVVFIEEDGAKKILLRQTREVVKLADSGVPVTSRFCFYDQIHTTGMDIQHRLDAVAALTLGKDMVWRDFAQGAYRMRGIGRVGGFAYTSSQRSRN
ncbi:unnamed protein product [Prorocentrum cordatum]|uniref:ubiquitinyl hydrolase 1 n=1 Tax=Prorocentrum cordatum TaxID=2364126 RepID=A0ABN9V3D9_9DINO|nr:unnamed protein product [Polarella glacialis]